MEYVMIFKKVSQFTGNTNEMDIPITQSEYNIWVNRWWNVENRTLIQDIFPNLSPSHREFLMTGATDAEWNDLFGSDGDE